MNKTLKGDKHEKAHINFFYCYYNFEYKYIWLL